jgi:hypothetical protein
MYPIRINQTEYPKNILFSNNIFHLNKTIHTDIRNSLGFRSDEFKNNHDGLHVIFNGCSVTEGDGLNLEEMWSKKLYNKISNINKVSGYYNIASSGTSIVNQIIMFFKYFKQYGNPDIIFFNMTENFRFYVYENNTYKSAFYSKESLPLLNLICYQYYFMLDHYCKTNNIKLFTFTWAGEAEGYSKKESKEYDNAFKSFDSFYPIDPKDLIIFINKYKKENENKLFYNYIERARDGDHPGVGHQEYWANFMYSKYMDSL